MFRTLAPVSIDSSCPTMRILTSFQALGAPQEAIVAYFFFARLPAGCRGRGRELVIIASTMLSLVLPNETRRNLLDTGDGARGGGVDHQR